MKRNEQINGIGKEQCVLLSGLKSLLDIKMYDCICNNFCCSTSSTSINFCCDELNQLKINQVIFIQTIEFKKKLLFSIKKMIEDEEKYFKAAVLETSHRNIFLKD